MRTDYVTQEDLETHCRCAGVFLTREDESDTKILLVETHRKKYQFSFPKGKRNRGEDTMTAAKRELYEETGIPEGSYEILPGRWYIEYKQDCDKPHIVYYAARLLDNDVTLCPQDTKEILKADWFTPEQIYTMRTELYLQRRQIYGT
jgi:8-oxo-dGTP pyrophosphatase MutT (NUDIX family)